ncbi:MAG: glycerol-3-phosphate 1-O-acyltransferase PlsY [Lachnospiraceae bacterium]|jgi:acyl-phosphate glycerol 3-phosphate acyltransferase|nr:glycerol-3-phosphate 1-O-acyltransferase PlsY [Lachnoclostridium sp.]MDD7522001.1 glycerol-3-phosphate 1-O-acyltransferase PlsY [Lachnoclostridium sp.]MDY2600005.1 glycerol-3-phosphate 1-O-acyltransferase PlsY [Lachnospiraceae bacterium]
MNSVIGQIIVWIIAGYLLGSVSFGMLVGKDAGVDIRTKGSGNIGTTNALRTLGKKAALITFLGDFFKAFIPVIIAENVSMKVFSNSSDIAFLISLITGLSAVLGHNFPVWIHFKGGKGIAVTAGVTVAIAIHHPLYWILALLLFIIIVVITRYVSVGSLCVPAWSIPVYVLIYERSNEYLVPVLIISFIYTILAFIKHSTNIKRLINGTENKLFGNKKKDNQEVVK